MKRHPAPEIPVWLTAMLPTGVTRYLVDIGEYRMHVMEVGQGTPVLMLHGNPAWGFLYHRVAAALSGEPLRLIMPDLVGLGFSDKPTNPALHQLGDIGRAYRYPLRHVRDRVAPLALARMVPDSLAHPSVPVLERCQAFVESFTGPAAIVWGERDPILGRVSKRVARALPGAKVTMTQAGHFLQEEVPDEIAAAITWVAAQTKGKTQRTP